MQYELYIDVFFLMNFMMDFLLLSLIRRVLAEDGRLWQRVLGAGMGAGLTCLVIVMHVPAFWMRALLYHGVIGVLMVKLGLDLPFGKPLLRGVLLLYAGGILLGGGMYLFRARMREGSLFFFCTLLGYLFATGIWSFMERLAGRRASEYEVCLYMHEKGCKLRALYDTGNHLQEEGTHLPVHLIRQDVLMRLGVTLDDLTRTQTPRRISYRSVGTSDGELMAFQMEKLCIRHGRHKKTVVEPLIGIFPADMDSMEYEMILNPAAITGFEIREGEKQA